MPPSKQHTFAISKAEAARLVGALVLIKPYLISLSAVWNRMTDEQKRNYLEHSPVFAEIVSFMKPFKDVM